MGKAKQYEKNLLSIIIPVYNVEPYISKCLEAAINQTYPYLDIIVVDDGSTDGSGQICDAYQNMDKRIRVFHKKNGGPSSARNLGLHYAKGEFIGFVDSDDFIDLDMYESMLQEMEDDVDIVTCGRYISFPKEKHINSRLAFYTSKRIKMNTVSAIEEWMKGSIFSFSVCDKVFRRRLFDAVSFPVGRASEDIPVTYTLFTKSRNIVHLGKPKYHNFHRDGSISRQGFYYRRIDNALFIGEICKDIRERYPQFIMQAEALYIRTVADALKRIQSCEDRFQYKHLEKRFLRVIRHMYLRIMRNPYIGRKIKRKLLMLMFTGWKVYMRMR